MRRGRSRVLRRKRGIARLRAGVYRFLSSPRADARGAKSQRNEDGQDSNRKFHRDLQAWKLSPNQVLEEPNELRMATIIPHGSAPVGLPRFEVILHFSG